VRVAVECNLAIRSALSPKSSPLLPRFCLLDLTSHRAVLAPFTDDGEISLYELGAGKEIESQAFRLILGALAMSRVPLAAAPRILRACDRSMAQYRHPSLV